MEEIIKPLQEFEHLNDCKLPLIDRIQKIDYYFENDIKDLNKSVLLLEKAIINNNESIKNIFKKEEEKKRIFKIKKNIIPSSQLINSFKNSKSTQKIRLINLMKNPFINYKSSNNLFNNNLNFMNSNNIQPFINNLNFSNKDNNNQSDYFNSFHINKPTNIKNYHYPKKNLHEIWNKKTPKKEKEKINKLQQNYLPLLNDINLSYDNNINNIHQLQNPNINEKLRRNYSNYTSFSVSSDKDSVNSNSLITKYSKLNINFNSYNNFIFSSSKKTNHKKIFSNKKSNINISNIKSSNKNIKKGISNQNNLLNKREKTKNISAKLINLIRQLRKNNLELNKNLNNCKYKFEEMNFNFGTKLKYSKWKYQISDYQKYFIDIEHFGERERNEIEKKKTFYDFLEDAVDSISEIQKKKKYALSGKRKKIYENNNKYNTLEDKNTPDRELSSKQKTIQNFLENINKRKIKEKEKRNEIKILLEDSLREATNAMKI